MTDEVAALTQFATDAWAAVPALVLGEHGPRLRRENKQLRQEREILKAAATFFAKENA